MREAFGCRWTRTATTALLAYLLLLQALIASIAQGAMAAATAIPLQVICTPNGIVVAPATDEAHPAGKVVHGHCATLCQ
jgi:hypothetical protein